MGIIENRMTGVVKRIELSMRLCLTDHGVLAGSSGDWSQSFSQRYCQNVRISVLVRGADRFWLLAAGTPQKRANSLLLRLRKVRLGKHLSADSCQAISIKVRATD